MSSRARLLERSTDVCPDGWIWPIEELGHDNHEDPGESPDPVDDAFRRGIEEGGRVARRVVEAELRHQVVALHAGLAELRTQRDGMLAGAEGVIVELALAIARRVLRDALEVNPAHVTALARSGLAAVSGASELRLRAHPDDLSFIAGSTRSPDAHIAFVPDPTLARGSCHVESAYGEVDASLDAQLAELTRALREPAGVDDTSDGR
jgi:flagellar biosynthesis/type III secretory pathway protein FliH